VEEVVVPAQVCACDPSGCMGGCCNRHIEVQKQVETGSGTVMGEDALMEAYSSEKRKELLAPGLEPTSTVPCTSAAVDDAEGGQRVREFEDQR